MNETPRTDGALFHCQFEGRENADLIIKLARQLERELAASRAEVEELKNELQEAVEDAQRNLEATIPTAGDYVCGECYCGHHDNCSGTEEEKCDCVTCLYREVERLTGELENTESLRKQAHDLLIESMKREKALRGAIIELLLVTSKSGVNCNRCRELAARVREAMGK